MRGRVRPVGMPETSAAAAARESHRVDPKGRRVLAWLAAAGVCITLSTACNDDALVVAPDGGSGSSALTPEQASAVVARVGDRVITLGEFAATIERMNRFDRLRYQTSEQRRQLLEQMVDAELLAQEARRRGLDKDEKVERQVQQILKEAMLAKAREGLGTLEDITDNEVREYYEQHRDDFVEPERRRVSAIVLTDRAKAEDVLAQAKKNTSGAAWGKLFAESSVTAKQSPAEPSPTDLAGSLGIVGPPDDPRGANPKVPEAVRKALFALGEIGQIADEPVEADGQFYVVRMSGRTAGHTRSVADAARSIRILLLQERIKKAEANAVTALRKRFDVRIDADALANVKIPTAVERMAMPWQPGEQAATAEPSHQDAGAIEPPR